MKIALAAKKFGMSVQTIRSLIKEKEIRGNLKNGTVEVPYLSRYVSTCTLYHKPAIKKRSTKVQKSLERQHVTLQKNIRAIQSELNKLKKISKKVKDKIKKGK